MGQTEISRPATATGDTEKLADDYLVMERGQFIAQGLGSQMQQNGVRKLVSI